MTLVPWLHACALLQAAAFASRQGHWFRQAPFQSISNLSLQVSSTYFSRVHIARITSQNVENEVDVDARPSDAINLAMRFGGACMHALRTVWQWVGVSVCVLCTHKRHVSVLDTVLHACRSALQPPCMCPSI